jgi:transcriptional regulator with XRE-family HTH domain
MSFYALIIRCEKSYVKENIMDTLQIMGQRLRELRTERKLPQRELAGVLNVTLRHYQRVEHGEINLPVLTLCALADYYGVTTDYLLGRSETR